MTNSAQSPSTSRNIGRLYVVATPIGNLGDISQRVVDTLASVDLIACEDTRHTKKLCRHLNINTPLVSYYREKERSKAEGLVAQLLDGKRIALVSDAGTPGLCDPGAILVRKAREAGIPIEAVAGPSALTTAISIAGLSHSHFFFGGFLSAQAAERKHLLKSVTALPYPLIFYEAPHRIHSTLTDMIAILGNRQAQLFRELTKIHEECLEGSLAFLAEHVHAGVKGELVLIVQGAELPAVAPPDNLDELLIWYRDVRKESLKSAVHHIATDLGIPRSQVYKKALAVWHQSE